MKASAEIKKTGTSFQGLSRTLQDAAFGPGAIANNLAELGRDFTELSASAKASGQSIGKTLVQSLTGAGGLNLALGGLTLGLSLASFGLSAWTRLFGEADKEVKSTSDALKEYVENLNALDQSRVKGSQSAQSELTDLKVLYGAYQNGNLPLDQRKKAYAELQKQYPAYFKNLQFEEKAGKATSDAYKSLAGSILAAAQARAFSDKISKNAQEQLAIEEKLATLLPTVLKARERQAKLSDQAFELTTQGGIQAERTALAAIREANKARETRIDLEKRFFELTKQQRAIITENAKLAERAQQLIVQGIQKEDTEVKKLTASREKLFLLQGRGLVLPQIKQDALKAPTLQLPEDVLTRVREFNSRIVTAVTELGPLIQSSLESSFGGIGEAIGNALASGENVFAAFGQAALASIGDVLVQFGKLTIAAGVAALGLNAALSNPTNPGAALAAIAAGTALVAVGSAVKKFSANLGGSGVAGGGR